MKRSLLLAVLSLASAASLYALDRDAFTNGVPLRERISGLKTPAATTTLTAAGLGIGAAGIAWYVTKKRRA